MKSERTTRRRLAVVAAVVALAAVPAAALGDEVDPAEKSFQRGTAAMDAGRFEEACPAIEESYKLDPLPGTLFTLAECEARRGRIATAVKRYEDYLALYAALAPERKKKQGDREQVAREQTARLSPLVPELTLTLPPAAPPGTVVTRDGAPVAAAALGVAMPVDPGDHEIAVQAPGGPATLMRVTLGKGEKKGLLLEVKELPVTPPAPVALPTPAPEGGTSGRRIGAFVVGGVGLAAVVVGAITGALAIAGKSTINQNCGSSIGRSDPAACNATGKSAADSVKTYGLVSTLGFGVGIAGVGTSVVLLLTEPKEKAADASGFGIGLRGVW
jgi:hypothetical protein